MRSPLGRQAGSAVVWKSIQMVGVKAIFLIRTLVLARLLLPEDFGLLAISMIAVDFLLSVTNLGMVPALVQRLETDERQYNTAWTVGIARALLIGGIVFLAAPLIATLFAEPRATDLIRVVAVRPLLEAMVSIKVADLMRNLRFRRLAYIYLPEAVVNTAVSISLAPFLGVWALIAGALAGAMAQVIASYLLAPHRPMVALDLAAVRPLIQFGRWIFLIGVIAVTGSSALQLVISRNLGTAELGLYFLAAKIAFVPAEISSEVVGAVAFPLYARLQENLTKLVVAFRAILTGMLALLLPVCALLIALAPSLAENVLGPRWEGTVPLISLLALVNVIGLFGDTVAPIFKGTGRPSYLALIELVQSGLLVALIWGLTNWLGLVGAAVAWLLAVGASQLLSLLFIRRLLPEPVLDLGRPLSLILLISLTGAVVAWGLDRALPGLVGFILGGFAGTIIIAALLWFSDRRWQLGLAANAGLLAPRLVMWRRAGF
jgi:O-antigen/teichoic acid export membrane protein